jgi:hypothetical protein
VSVDASKSVKVTGRELTEQFQEHMTHSPEPTPARCNHAFAAAEPLACRIAKWARVHEWGTPFDFASPARISTLTEHRLESSPTHPLASPPLPIQRYSSAAHTRCVPIPSELQRLLAPRSPPISIDLPRPPPISPRSPPLSPALPRLRLASNIIQVSALPAAPRGGEAGGVPMSVPTL